MSERASLEMPSWPALMPIETACAYLGLSPQSFRTVTKVKGVRPVDLGISVTRWRKADLDTLVDRLAVRGSELTPAALTLPDPADLALERASRRAKR